MAGRKKNSNIIQANLVGQSVPAPRGDMHQAAARIERDLPNIELRIILAYSRLEAMN